MARATRTTRARTPARTRRARGTEAENLDREINGAVAGGRPVDLASAHPEPPPAPRPGPGGDRIDEDNPAPAQRQVADPAAVVAQLSSSGGESYIKEYELRTLHRLLLRNTQLSLIARAMGKSITEVQRLRRTLYNRLRREAGNLDMLTHAGRTIAFFGEIKGMALRVATDDAVQPVTRLRAMDVARGAEMDLHKFLHVAGFYSGPKFLPKTDDQDPAAREAGNMQRIANAIVNPTLTEEEYDDIIREIAAERELAGSLDTDQDTNIL